jgi:hypothetical protein
MIFSPMRIPNNDFFQYNIDTHQCHKFINNYCSHYLVKNDIYFRKTMRGLNVSLILSDFCFLSSKFAIQINDIQTYFLYVYFSQL